MNEPERHDFVLMEATQDSRPTSLGAVGTIDSLRGGLTLDLAETALFRMLWRPRISLLPTGLYEKKEGLIHPA